jgi:cytochrome c-type biogenesis protein CcmH
MIKTFSLSVLIIVITILFSKTNIYPVEPEEFLQNPKQELKARNISKNVRCLVCQNQSIDESAAPLAKDLRILIRKKVKEGHTENEIYKFLTDRYGDFILLKPPLKRTTFMLWFLPFVFLAIGIFILSWHHKKSKKKLPHI